MCTPGEELPVPKRQAVWFKAVRVTSESWSCSVLLISSALLPQRSSQSSGLLCSVCAPNFCGLEPNRKYLQNEKWLRFVLKYTPCLTCLLDGILPIFLHCSLTEAPGADASSGISVSLAIPRSSSSSCASLKEEYFVPVKQVFFFLAILAY